MRQDWQVPAAEVDASCATLFARFKVWRLYADPPYWQCWIAAWRGSFGEERVVEWWTNRRRPMAYALEGFDTAIRDGCISHDGNLDLTRHLGERPASRTSRTARRAGQGALADSQGAAGLPAQDRPRDGGGALVGGPHRCRCGGRGKATSGLSGSYFWGRPTMTDWTDADVRNFAAALVKDSMVHSPRWQWIATSARDADSC